MKLRAIKLSVMKRKDMNIKTGIYATIFGMIILLTSACGAKGGLYLPEEEAVKPQQSEEEEKKKKKNTDSETQTESETN